MDSSQYRELFMEESREHLQSLNNNLLVLEKQPDNTEVINEIFRSAHTLKGMAGSMGFKTMADLAHAMENVLDTIRKGNMNVSVEVMDALFEALDMLEGLLQDIGQAGVESPRDISGIRAKLEGFINSTVAKDYKPHKEGLSLDEHHVRVISEAVKDGFIPYYIEVKLKESCLMKAARAYIVFRAIENFGHIIHSQPSVQDIEEEKFELSFSVVALCRAEIETIKRELDSISEIESISIKEISLDDIQSRNRVERAKFKSQGIDKITAQEVKERPSKAAGRSIRVDIERLDRLMNLVSELIIIKNRFQDLQRYEDKAAMAESVEYLGRVTSDLHDAVMKARMIPIQTVFERFPRTVRDLSRNTGKDVRLNIVGAETEVDRTIIDEIGEPLVHLIRNAVDHGIESPQERAALGKPLEGTVELKAYYDGDNVVIEVSDDGRGIDIDKVLKRAVQQNLVSSEEAESLSQQEILQFIFEPGFSTAERVTDISGRGVGMDVVKTKIESMGGTVDVDSRPNQGTRFIIRLPLTLSIIQVLLVTMGQEVYAIPISSIKEIMEVPVGSIKLVRQKEFIDYRGLLIPFVRLAKVLECPDEQIESEGPVTVVIVKKGEKLAALSVSQLMGHQEIVIKPLGKALAKIKIVSGATILGDGRVALILDVNHLI
ncbi:two-component system chemotaxis sensor kinase CheA [Caldicoprobacter guelmensis]|uniref:chemotaxis protein CheA n=1 Tax=Caldicoprobacter guelmensis TaxID=1170224 RepID=UPI001958C6FD|nr:chemotaxis protein CheA [Caldicoprobacter guelmensis]MBM7581402.1 two-component system chemotaxis sensor kinase CheA [Caldicoprobacter guelmensis]